MAPKFDVVAVLMSQCSHVFALPFIYTSPPSIVSVPLIVGGPFDAKLSNEEKEYLISAGLISSGLLSLIQIYRLKLGDSGYYIGTGG